MSYAPLRLVAVEGIEPSSLDYQSSALPLGYTAMVDPAGLKPALHGLKGRCSVTRAPDQKIGCGGRTRTFACRINSAVPYQLGYATKLCLGHREAQEALLLCFLCFFVAGSGCGDESRTRINSFTRRFLLIQLCYTARCFG